MKSIFSPSIRFALIATMAVFAAASHAQYVVTDLNPAGANDSWGYSTGNGSQAGYATFAGTYKAGYWNGTSGSYVSLHGAGYDHTFALSMDGNTQVGYGMGPATGGWGQALGWNGTAASMVNINPVGFSSSAAVSISGSSIVGYGQDTNNRYQALLWSGLNNSPTILTPANQDNAFAISVNGNIQVGYVNGAPTGNKDQAVLWQGTAASVVDLHPTGYDYSYAFSTSGNMQAGQVVDSSFGMHAGMWMSSATSFVDLHPTGADYSSANGTNGSSQVGYAVYSGTSHAILWNGSAASAVDLNAFLPSGFVGAEAYSIAANGDILGYAYTSTGRTHAVTWTQSVPEPASMGAIALGIAGLLRRRKASRKS